MNIGDGARLELLDFFMFCYQGDMLSADGDDDAALEAIICKAQNKFRQLAPLLTNNDVSHTLTSYESEIIHKLCEQLYVTWQ